MARGLKMILEYQGKYPKIDPTAFVAENATVIGDVEIGPGTNIWFQSVVPGGPELYSDRFELQHSGCQYPSCG